VAETLQHALLPETLPPIAGAATAVQYLPGVKSMHIGGDWYDVIALDDSRMLFVVGDVSGRGVRAAAVMASLRYAVRAYAAEGDGPGTILEKLSRLFTVERDGHFATVLCIQVDVPARQLTIANAGHLPPLIVPPAGTAELVTTDVGVPVGVAHTRPYTTTRASVPPGATLLAYTDGLVERRGESIDSSVERLRATAGARGAEHGGSPLPAYLEAVVHDLVGDGVDDDTVLLGVRWLN
jgi:serine phosphatase RsbU (regulator of sigma subunit)